VGFYAGNKFLDLHTLYLWLNTHMKEQLDNLTGQLLVAIPNTAHTAFTRGVMLVTNQWAGGYTSFMINRVLNTGQTVSVVMQNAGINFTCPDPIFYGGPDETHKVQFVHTLDWQCSSTKPLTDKIGITHEFSLLAAIAAGNGPDHWRCVLGHRIVTNAPGYPEAIHGELSGLPPWKPGDRWLTLPATIPNVFTGINDEQWLNCVTESSRLEVANWF
jgi:putative AlgH/UPF0301 family transcriptional regulator